MTGSRRDDGRDREHGQGLVRPYVVTDGRSTPTRNHFDHVTLVMGRPEVPCDHLSPEQQRVLDLCMPGALSVAELSGYLDLPVSVLRVVLADLMDGGHIISRAAVPDVHPRHDRPLLEALLRGLRSL